MGRMPHDRSRVPIHTDGSTVISSPSIDEVPAPRAELGEPLRVQGDAVACPQDVPLLLDDVEQPVPGEIGCDAIGFVDHDAKRVQRILDLDPVVQHVLVEPVLVDRVRQVHRGLLVAAPHQHEGVLDPEVGVVPDAGDEEDVAGAVVGVEVGAVVEVAVRGSRPGDRLRNLVDGEFVHGSEHQFVSPISRFKRLAW